MSKNLFNNDWQFSKQPLQEDFSLQSMQKNKIWNLVDIPHDWNIENVMHLSDEAEGWYKKVFSLTKEQAEERVLIHFDGVYFDSELFINNQTVGKWAYGYTAFHFNISDYIHEGENTIYMRIKYHTPNSRWYSGAGIYRNVWLENTKDSYIKVNGVYQSAHKTRDNQWQLKIETAFHVEEDLIIEHQIIDKDGKIILKHESNIKLSEQLNQIIIHVNNPDLWSTDYPNLYTIRTFLKTTRQILQEILTPLGFRTIELDANKGLYINGHAEKIKGVCLHHDLGALGSAFSISAQRRIFSLLKKMGVNAIRTAHNPAAKEFYDLADEMGFLIQSEFTDVWRHGKNKYDYSYFFEKWFERDVESWVTRDRNHPCIFMWSIGNEIYDTHGREDGTKTTIMLRNLTRKYDFMENAFITFGSNYLQWEGTQKAAQELQAIGYNYGENLYALHHKKFPKWIIYGSETCSVAQSRGVYHFPLRESILADDDYQCSSLGNSPTSWGAKSIETCIVNERNCEYSLGQFLWSGVDYIGEPTPYNMKNAYLGQIDTAGFPKDAFYIFQAAWVPVNKKPMIHIFPYWDFCENQMIDLRVCSNTSEIELFFNSKSLGKRIIDHENGDHLIENWKMPYKKGVLVAKGYDKKGQIICEDRVESFEDSSSIVLSADKAKINADGTDLVFVEIETTDHFGIKVANACDRINVEIDGPARLVGMDNGDSTDYDQYKTNSRKLFNGKALAIIASTFESGEIKIKVSGEGLISDEIIIQSNKSDITFGTTNFLDDFASKKVNEKGFVGVRKVELTMLKGPSEHNPDAKIILEASRFPSNASKQNLLWRVTDAQGIDTRIAEYTIKENKIEIVPKANGEIFVRCGIRNEKEHLDRYSMISFEVKNLKKAFLNPYQAVSGGLYSRSNVELTNGNERGVATLRGQESWVIFDDVDFGSFGSDELQLSLFPLEKNPFEIEIWKGVPNNTRSHLIDTVKYTRGSQWNTYQEQNYKLKSKLSGITTITLVFNQKVHIKCFEFKKINRAYSLLSPTESDLVYGDSFEKVDNTLEKIGNNVTIQFNHLNFQKGLLAIKINGRSFGRRNTIRVQFTNDEGQTKIRSIEFPESDSYVEKTFAFRGIEGRQNVEFIFLPGANFDFKNFQFIPSS